MEDLEEGMTKVTVLVRHSLPSYYEDWNNGEKGSTAREMFVGVLSREVLRSSLRICLTFKKMSSLRQKLFKILLTTTQFFVKLV